MNPDVLIIGGGSAGVAAALAAARQGADTLLVERHGFFGGAGTASLVHSFCGLYELPLFGRFAAPKSRIQASLPSLNANCSPKASHTARCVWARSMC
jgi:glycine/D-amino acid oxidase-like deaminating enzyme